MPQALTAPAMKTRPRHNENEFPYLKSADENSKLPLPAADDTPSPPLPLTTDIEVPYLTPADIKEGPYLVAEDEHGGSWGKFNELGVCHICGTIMWAGWKNLATGDQVCDEHVALSV
jgi:hypothetical protein